MWASNETKDKLIQKYVLGIDKMPQWFSQGEVCFIISLFLIVGSVMIIIIFRRREKKLIAEMKRMAKEKTGLQERGLGPLEHSS